MAKLKWETSLNKGLERARKENKLLLVDFYNAHWIGCKQLEAVTYPDDKVCASISENFIPVQMDFSKQEKEVKEFGVNWTPTIVFLDKDGKEHYRFTGFYGPDEYKAQLGLARGKTLFDLDQFDPAIQCFK